MQSKILLDARSPAGNIFAAVEEFADAIYFNLYGPEGVVPMGENPERWSGMRSCWVGNCVPVPDTDAFDMQQIVKTMEQGIAPRMPGKHCRHASTGLALDPTRLQVVWFEEGDCAALLHKGEILAVIPPWATPAASDRSGYAKEFKGSPFLGMGDLAEVLPEIAPRVKHAEAFWASWEQEETWGSLQEKSLHTLESHFGKHTRYASIDGKQFPPRALVFFENETTVFFITIGMCIFAQPRVELFVDTAEQYRRIEIGMAVDKALIKESSFQEIGNFIAWVASMPWNDLIWFGPNCTFNSDLFSDYNATFFVDTPNIPLSSYADDPVTLLWMIPLRDAEFAYLQEHGADALVKKLSSASSHYWIHKPRASVV